MCHVVILGQVRPPHRPKSTTLVELLCGYGKWNLAFPHFHSAFPLYATSYALVPFHPWCPTLSQAGPLSPLATKD